MSFMNKIVLITGAGSGIGEAISLHFAKLSARLALIDIDPDNLLKVVEKCENLTKTKVLKLVTDVSKDVELREAVNSTVNEFGRIDVLINCAGVNGRGRITDPNVLDDFDKVIGINLRATVAAMNFASKALIESKGCVVNISSVMSKLVGASAIAYNVSKAGISHLTKCAALELSEHGVRVNCIAPGPVKTSIMKNAGLSPEESEKLWASVINQVPLKHDVKAEEIAEMTAFLASDKANSMTGCEIVVDSGLSISACVKY